jgi:hypothetical protein
MTASALPPSPKTLEHPNVFDALQLPVLRRIARWRWGRLVFQLPLLAVAVLLMYDGFTGPRNAAQNLATVVPWVHYRGFVIVALLLVGNLFCMGCPFTLPRTLAKRFSLPGRRFPQVLRNKWLAIGGLFTLFFLYEWLDFWASPWLTAWVIVFYFVASFALEAFFSESAFCKYVCPLGTFNFVYSTVSPLQIRAKDTDICRTCVGKECINGSYSPQPVILIDQIGVMASRTKRTPTTPRARLDAARSCSRRRCKAAWIARSASTVCAPARTTTSACWRVHRGASCSTPMRCPAVTTWRFCSLRWHSWGWSTPSAWCPPSMTSYGGSRTRSA